MHRLALIVGYRFYRRNFLIRTVEDNFDTKSTEKFRATHRQTCFILSYSKQFNSPPFERIMHGRVFFQAYLSQNSKLDEEKSRLLCFERICRTSWRKSSYRTPLHLWASPICSKISKIGKKTDGAWLVNHFVHTSVEDVVSANEQ